MCRMLSSIAGTSRQHAAQHRSSPQPGSDRNGSTAPASVDSHLDVQILSQRKDRRATALDTQPEIPIGAVSSRTYLSGGGTGVNGGAGDDEEYGNDVGAMQSRPAPSSGVEDCVQELPAQHTSLRTPSEGVRAVSILADSSAARSHHGGQATSAEPRGGGSAPDTASSGTGPQHATLASANVAPGQERCGCADHSSPSGTDCSPESSGGAAETVGGCASLSRTAAEATNSSSEVGEALRTCQVPSQAQVRFT